SIETQGAGGGGRPGDREAAIFRDIERLRVLRRRIGDGLAKEVRHIRPGGRRRAIRLRDLVDQVCCADRTLTDVLRGHGWGVDAKCRDGLRRALCGALDRMQGFGLVYPQEAA
ncbi:hypothetical protein RISW2_06085, partial [Roseivivax isoporae LMG 25204]